MKKTVLSDIVDGTSLTVVMKLASCWLGNVTLKLTVEIVQTRRTAPGGN